MKASKNEWFLQWQRVVGTTNCGIFAGLQDNWTVRDTATSDAAEVRERIEDVLASIRPAVRNDGGDIEFVDFDQESGLVQLRMVGACYACPMSMATLRAGIEQRLRRVISEVTSVEAV